MMKRIMSGFLIVCFLVSSVVVPPKAHANSLLGLPEPGAMVFLSSSYAPALIKGVTLDPKNPFKFDFIVDTGDSLPLVGRAREGDIKQESTKLIKYFLAALTIPEEDLWVNLSPYEKDRKLPQNLSQTEMGRDMLAQDYLLKQITASLIYPEKDLGKEFWDKIYSKAQQLYGNTQIPVNTFNKVWIVADKADVYEHGQSAFVIGAHLKVMLEEDYLAKSKNQMPTRGHVQDRTTKNVSPSPLPSETGLNAKAPQGNPDTTNVASQIIREIILPELEKEVNNGKNFAPLRQMFYSMILASWFKLALKDAVMTQVYGNQSKVKVGVNAADPGMTEQIYQRYLQAYKKGVFNYIKEDPIDSLPLVGRVREGVSKTIPRKYFSGGLQIADPAMIHRYRNNASAHKFSDSLGDNIFNVSVTMTTPQVREVTIQASLAMIARLTEEEKGVLLQVLQDLRNKSRIQNHNWVVPWSFYDTAFGQRSYALILIDPIVHALGLNRLLWKSSHPSGCAVYDFPDGLVRGIKGDATKELSDMISLQIGILETALRPTPNAAMTAVDFKIGDLVYRLPLELGQPTTQTFIPPEQLPVEHSSGGVLTFEKGIFLRFSLRGFGGEGGELNFYLGNDKDLADFISDLIFEQFKKSHYAEYYQVYDNLDQVKADVKAVITELRKEGIIPTDAAMTSEKQSVPNGMRVYAVTKDETLSVAAEKAGVTVAQLARANGLRADPNLPLVIGQHLIVNPAMIVSREVSFSGGYTTHSITFDYEEDSRVVRKTVESGDHSEEFFLRAIFNAVDSIRKKLRSASLLVDRVELVSLRGDFSRGEKIVLSELKKAGFKLKYYGAGSNNVDLVFDETPSRKRQITRAVSVLNRIEGELLEFLKPSSPAMIVEAKLKEGSKPDTVKLIIESLNGRIDLSFSRINSEEYQVNFGGGATQTFKDSEVRVFVYGALVVVLHGDNLSFYAVPHVHTFMKLTDIMVLADEQNVNAKAQKHNPRYVLKVVNGVTIKGAVLSAELQADQTSQATTLFKIDLQALDTKLRKNASAAMTVTRAEVGLVGATIAGVLLSLAAAKSGLDLWRTKLNRVYNMSAGSIELRLPSTNSPWPGVVMTNAPAVNAAPGGIDLNAQNMGLNVSKDAQGGVQVTFDSAMIERMKREGFDGFVPVILNITPVTNILPLLGLAPRKEDEEKLVKV